MMKLVSWILHFLQMVTVYNQFRPDESRRKMCPQLSESLMCECQQLSDGINLSCSSISQGDLDKLLSSVRWELRGLRLTGLPAEMTHLPRWILSNVSLDHLTIHSSHVKEVDEKFFEQMERSLVKLEISDSRLIYVPRGINKIGTLRDLNLSGNNITELYPYSFYGASLSSLNLANNFLFSLSDNSFLGLEGNLHTLILDHNRFQKFPMPALKNLQGLKSISLVGNSIERIPTSLPGVLVHLEQLYLSSNEFKVIPATTFASMRGLKTLDLSSNQINDVEYRAFHNLENLEVLNLQHNRLMSLPSGSFKHNKKLRTLYLSNNHLREVSGLLVNLPALHSLHLQHNYLLNLSDDVFERSTGIHELYLQNNVLYELSENVFKPLKKLRDLQLSFNFISKIPEQLLKRNIAVTSLGLDNNQIRNIDTRAFIGVSKLEILTLNHNSLKEIDRELFSGLSSLRELSLHHNKLTSIQTQSFSSLSSLQYLDLAGNKLVNLDDVMMRYPSSLVSLYIMDNKLTGFDTFTFSGQTTLEVIQVGNNKLEKISEKQFHELINLFRLSLPNNRIEEIEDNALGHCVQLRFLDLSLNKLRALKSATLSGLNQLEEIDLSGNRLESIERGSFQSLHHLKILNLAGNQLTSLGEGAFHGCRAVHTLNLHSSMVRVIQTGAFKPFSSVVNLDLSYNSVSDLSSWTQLEVMDRLEHLQVSGNNLANISRRINLSRFPKLKRLEVESCQITELNPHFLGGNKDLRSIKLGSNILSFLPTEFFSKQVFLKELSLDGNRFDEVPGDSMRYLYNLRTLNLSSNLLTELSDSSFDEVIGLTHLDISNNILHILSNRVFHNVTKLEWLELSGNELSEFPSTTFLPLPNLHTVHLNNNRLNYIPVALQGLRNVTEMHIEGNPLSRLRQMISSSGVMSTLKHLHISGSELVELQENDTSLCPALLTLSLRRNQITIIRPRAFMSQNVLIKLDLSENKLIRLPSQSLNGLVRLELLNISHNSLGFLDIFSTDLKMIKILDLSENNILTLDASVFDNLVNLVKLDVRGNKITQLSSQLFLKNNLLKSLDLRFNELERIPVDALSPVEHSLQKLHLQDNPLVCSCRTYRHKLWFKQNRKWFDSSRRNSKVGPQCTQPESLQNRHLLTIKDSELCPLPSVNSFDIRNITTNSVLIAWDSRDSNMTGLKGFLVAYHRLDKNDVVKKYKVNPTTRMFQLFNLMDNSVYLVCIITQGSSYSDYDYTEEDTNMARMDRDSDQEDDYSQTDYRVLAVEEEDEGDDLMGDGGDLEIPSSNDTRYLITKPIILNLDSKSSRCNKIKTPVDPSKVQMIDNKQLSAVIGCTSGLMIFFCIIISIIVAKPKRDEDDEEVVVAKSDSLTDSYKSPSTKSRSGSTASSLNKLNGAELKKGDSLTLQRRSTESRQVSPNSKSSDSRTKKQTLRRGISKQSSTESGPSRHSSSETSAARRVQRQSSEYLPAPRSRNSDSISPPRKRGKDSRTKETRGREKGKKTREHHEDVQRDQEEDIVLEDTEDRDQEPRNRDSQVADQNHRRREPDPYGGGGGGGRYDRDAPRKSDSLVSLSHPGPRTLNVPAPGPRDQHRTDFHAIPMVEYGDSSTSAHAQSATLRVPSESWRSGGGGGGGMPNGGSGYRYSVENLSPRYDEVGYPENGGIEYYPDYRRTGKTGYIKYNSLSAAKY